MIPSTERALREGPSAALADEPRFALRFETGRGRLVLARPMRFAFGVIDRLELDLGRLRFPLDLAAGVRRFRDRRTRAIDAAVTIDLEAVLATLREPPFAAHLLARSEHGVSVAIEDAFGTIAVELWPHLEGGELLLLPSALRAATSGPMPPIARLWAAARALGVPFDERRAAIRLPRAFRLALAEALLPRGLRVPDERVLRLAPPRVEGRRWLKLEPLPSGAELEAAGGPSFEARLLRSRRLEQMAPALAALALGDREGSVVEATRLAERLGSAAMPALRELALVGVELPDRSVGLSDASDLPSRCAALRRALEGGHPAAALAEARALDAEEPCHAIAVEALCAAAELALDTDPAGAAAALERAAVRRPRDVRLALKVLEALLGVADEASLRRGVGLLLEAHEPGPPRGRLAREAALLAELAGAVALEAWLLDVAREHLPHDPRVLAGAARVARAAGDLDASLARLEEAAVLFAAEGDRDAEASVRRRSARTALELGRIEEAERHAARAVELGPDDEQGLALLVKVRAGLNAPSLRRAEDQLLAAVERVEPGAGSAELIESLLDASRRALAREELARARALLDASARLGAEGAAFEELSAALRGRGRARLEDAPEAWIDAPREALVAALEVHRDPEALVRGWLEAAPLASLDEGALTHLIGVALDAPAPVTRHVAAALVEVTRLPLDVALIRALAERSELEAPADGDPAAAVALWRALASREREAGREAEAALALAHAGRLSRDMTTLRVALRAARLSGDLEAALEVVGLALEAAGHGPARAALERERDAIRSALD